MKNESQITLTVHFNKVTWCAEQNEDGLAWGIYKCYTDKNSDDEITIKGKIDPTIAQRGMKIEVVGNWEHDKKYGKQFVFLNYSRCQPNGRWGTIAFIMQADGIGETLAGRIYDAFGENSISTLIEQPGLVVSRTPGLRLEVANEASDILAPLIGESKLKIPLIDLFKGTRLPARTADRVIEARIPDPVNTLKKNPFILMEFHGIAFKQCDSLRVKLELSSTMPERITAACEQTFSDTNDQTWLSIQSVSKGMRELLEVPDVNTVEFVSQLVDASKIIRNPVGKGEWYALQKEAEDELFVATNLYQRMKLSAPKWPIERIMNDEILTDHQKEVVIHNMKIGGRLIVLPGSPGVGKTHTLGRILGYFNDVAACAPTGKAAQRLSQSLKGIKATTIHRLLEPRPLSGGGFVFTLRNGELEYEVVAVDEASMVNNSLAASLFRALSSETYIILVGDKNQLPPVGPGTMLRDLQRLGKFKELTQIHRSEGMIVHTCAAIRDMEPVQLNVTEFPGEDIKPETNIHVVMAHRDERKAAKIQLLISKILDGKISGVHDPLSEIQFMTATHKNPNIGREVMNKQLQAAFNPEMKGDHQKLKVGDKVICTENSFFMPTKLELGENRTKLFVANGELGIITKSEEKKINVRLSNGEEIFVPCGKEGNGWDLGYCITTHKAQGSEWQISVTLMGNDYGSDMVMSREWFYTAISRAKKCSIIYAGPGQIQNVIKRVKIGDRKSFILEFMKDWESEETKNFNTAMDSEETKNLSTAMDIDN